MSFAVFWLTYWDKTALEEYSNVIDKGSRNVPTLLRNWHLCCIIGVHEWGTERKKSVRDKQSKGETEKVQVGEMILKRGTFIDWEKWRIKRRIKMQKKETKWKKESKRERKGERERERERKREREREREWEIIRMRKKERETENDK